MFEDVVNCADDYIKNQIQRVQDANINIDASISVGVDFPVPPLSVPLMSISKQLEDIQLKIMVIKEMLRQKARLLLERLKSLTTPDLYICEPDDFLLMMEVLVEAQFIYQNLHIVLEKIVEYLLNLLVKKFAELAKSIIDKLFSIWDKVIEIVPPLDDLLRLAWAIPNQADLCCNIALNIALPEVWGMV